MSEFPHLQLVRLQGPVERRKRSPFFPHRAPKEREHGVEILNQLDEAIASQKQDQLVDPSLIFRVRMEGSSQESEWEKLGMTMLASDEGGTIVLFSQDDDAAEFRRRLEQYIGPIRTNNGNRKHAKFVDGIGRITKLAPRDRIGTQFRKEGITEVDHFIEDKEYMTDIELWDFGARPKKEVKTREIEDIIVDDGGRVFDTYIGPSITVMRILSSGETLCRILGIAEVAYIDRPSKLEVDVSDFVEMEQSNVPDILPPDSDAPVVGIMDSGVNEHPFIADAIVKLTSFPEEIGTFDFKGHGTMVAGVTAFGDLRDIENREQIKPSVRLASARLLYGDSEHHDKQMTLPTQTDTAIRSLHHDLGCRIFVISLANIDEENSIGRVGIWAATLDELARELDVLILVSAGNRTPRHFDPDDPARFEETETEYPGYLLEAENLIFEPAGACNVITVGALANGRGVGENHSRDAHMRPLTEKFDPAPFTRRGPGGGGVCKPDFVDIGGTAVFDATAVRLRSAPEIPEAGIITLHYEYGKQLLTSSKGTSVAAPMLANKVADLIRVFPNATANLVRALLANASTVPAQCTSRLAGMNEEERKLIHGNGIVHIQNALSSNLDRIVLYTEDHIESNQFAVYKLPIPLDFLVSGNRAVRVSLAFDPPVRRTRVEYIGIKMSFKLVRGKTSEQIFEHFGVRGVEDDDEDDDKKKGFGCILSPGVNYRKRHNLQIASRIFRRKSSNVEEEYHLVVERVGGWAKSQEMSQKFAVVVELLDYNNLFLYERVSDLRENQLRESLRQRV